MIHIRNYLNHIKEKLSVNDRALHLPNFLPNHSDIITWNDVENCLNNPSLYEIELIDKTNSQKIQLPLYKKHWVSSHTFEKQMIVDLFNQGNSAAILNYGFYSQNTNELLRAFEETFYVSSAIHVYCGLEGSKSFNIHEDFPCNFIIQVDGNTHWKVYKNKASQLFAPRGYESFPVDTNMEIDLEIVLKPGDALYIPARAYHVALVQEKRLSISVPCWTLMNLDSSLLPDRNHYKIAS